LIGYFRAFRYRTDFRNLSLDQAVLCDFMVAGHLGRHLRRMRGIYSSRLGALQDAADRYLGGLLRLSDVRAGLCTAGFLENGLDSWQAEAQAATAGIEAIALDRYTLTRPDPGGLLLGFAAFDEDAIYQGVCRLAAALERKKPLPRAKPATGQAVGRGR